MSLKTPDSRTRLIALLAALGEAKDEKPGRGQTITLSDRENAAATFDGLRVVADLWQAAAEWLETLGTELARSDG